MLFRALGYEYKSSRLEKDDNARIGKSRKDVNVALM